MIPTTASASLFAFVLIELLFATVLYLLSKSMILSVLGGVLLFVPTVAVYLSNTDLFKGLFPTLLEKLALFSRFESFVGGIFDLSALVYFLSFSLFFVFLTVMSVEKRRFV